MIIDELKEIVQTTMPDRKIDYDHITLQSSLQKDLGFDSIAYIMLAIGIEAKYGVELSQLDTIKFDTVGDVVNYIENNKK
jgi:acyl carrier protein